MNTNELYFRCFEINDYGDEIIDSVKFIPISDVYYGGTPINDIGENLEHDGLVYILVDGEYQEINKKDLVD